ncbi:MAG: biotin carboxylase [Gammaproteobacteria bacterium]|nr:biotin carboxylase [Gammaproteobacteria bacterium]
MFNKILVANRGAIARRVIRACSELGIASVAVYSEADSSAPYLEEASEAHALTGNTAQETYLDDAALLKVLEKSGADALHPGYGFLAENADFARSVISNGATFIGPDPKWLASMGDKVQARKLMADAAFPVFPGSEPLEDLDQALVAAGTLGYPLMLKPSAGGGGIGMRVVRDDEELRKGFGLAQRMAMAAFADSAIYLESWLVTPRHVEFQLLGDNEGHVVHVHERDCSLQRRHQKIIEESPAPGLDRAEVNAIAESAARTAELLGYNNVGTLETLRDISGDYGFLEMNTRIQVEHGVTEAVTGLDLVAEQIRLASGTSLPAIPELHGHALEARIYAEDPHTHMPSTGVLQLFRYPTLEGVRIETGYREGQAVTPYYDPLLAKVIGWGVTREQAIGRVLIGLRAFTVQGVKTNIPLLARVLAHEEFLRGRVHTGFIQDLLSQPT